MAIAERQDEARYRGEILGAHLEHRLDVGHDLNELAVIEHQKVVCVQARRRRKIELDARALAAKHKALLLAAIIEFQQQRIHDLAKWRPTWRPTWRALGENLLRTWHGSGSTFSDESGAHRPARTAGRQHFRRKASRGRWHFR